MCKFLLLLCLILNAKASHSISKSGTHSNTNHNLTLHFRYYPQRSAIISSQPDAHNQIHIRVNSYTTRVTEHASRAITVHPNKRFVYVTGDFNYIHQYRIKRSAILRPLVPAEVVVYSHPMSITLDPSGRFVYVACSHGAICQYYISPSGKLKHLIPAVVYGNNNPAPLRFDSSGHYACTMTDGINDTTQTASIYHVAAHGQLSLIYRIITHIIPIESNILLKYKKVVVER